VVLIPGTTNTGDTSSGHISKSKTIEILDWKW
jgi:hypothetical protein